MTNVVITYLSKKMHDRRLIIISCFIIFGLAAGITTIWWYDRYDMLFVLNLPGPLLGLFLHGLWIRFVGEAPWLFKEPQVYLATSIIFWGGVGTLLTRFVKLKAIVWIAGIYLIVFGGLTIAIIYS